MSSAQIADTNAFTLRALTVEAKVDMMATKKIRFGTTKGTSFHAGCAAGMVPSAGVRGADGT